VCVQVPCVYLLSAASTVIRNKTYVHLYLLYSYRLLACNYSTNVQVYKCINIRSVVRLNYTYALFLLFLQLELLIFPEAGVIVHVAIAIVPVAGAVRVIVSVVDFMVPVTESLFLLPIYCTICTLSGVLYSCFCSWQTCFRTRSGWARLVYLGL
jgi:hypothetical protein